MNGSVQAVCYLQIEAKTTSLRYVEDDDPRRITGARVVRSSAGKPRDPIGGAVTVKITIEIPKSAFMPLCPEATVVIPEGMAEHAPIAVAAVDPREPSGD